MIPAKYWSPTKKLMLLGAMTGGKAVEDTATGNPLTFLTDLARPLKSLLIPFTPQQTGSGDPSPLNIRPIVPWDGLTVEHGGKNLFDVSTVVKGTLDGTGALVENNNRRTSAFITLTAGKYKLSRNALVDWWKAWSYKLDGTPDSKLSDGNGYEVTLTLTETCMIRISFDYVVTAENEVQLEAGSTATAYEPYKPITETDISFPSPVYGGTLDAVTGVLTVTHVLWTKNTANMNNDYDYPGWENAGVRDIVGADKGGAISAVINVGKAVAVNTRNVNDIVYLPKSDYSGMTQDQWKDLALDIQVAFPLATPQTVQLTPQQINALLGNNTIWSDADGSMTAVYFNKG